ncbi:hypothetical protein Val02_18950 [Virgisporangium aliadipatigenens]|uniref:N-acetyltransferase domain-containing protein n=1 Tax=Virgisporangium aliadipatigenens TaxID=741659 RepID=A0A8J4DP03_9ACTN|nr:hypothetical protein Val02_18950 [Virgisporangium aliadipatigenens]
MCLLADRPDLIAPVGLLRWREWGRHPEQDDPEFWIGTTREEAGRDGLPFTVVAVDADGAAVGVVGLGEFDHAELRAHSPWVMGMVVEPARREKNIGRTLMAELEARAARLGYRQLWVSTEIAAGFYERCGWERVGTAQVTEGPVELLTKRL